MRLRSSLSALVGSAAWLLASAAMGVQAPQGGLREGMEVARGVAPVRQAVTVAHEQVPRARLSAWNAFLQASGSHAWRSLWDTSTGVPLRIYGRGIAAPGASAGAEIAAKHARSFLAEHIDLLAPSVDPSAFELVANQTESGLRTVSFVQRARLGASSIPVLGGQVSFRYKNDRLFVIASEAIPAARATAPLASSLDAAAAAEQWIEAVRPGAHAEASELVVAPLLRASGFETRTAYRVQVAAGPLAYEVLIDARSAAPIARTLLTRFAAAGALFDVPVRAPQNERSLRQAPFLLIDVDGASSQTDALGAFAWTGPQAAAVDLGVSGSLVRVLPLSGTEAAATFTVADGEALSWSLADDEAGDAQLSGFIHTGLGKDRARIIAPSMTFLDQRLNVNVNGTDGAFACNAYWNGTSMNFFQASSQCNNTARLADVVYHELGHAFHQHAIVPGTGALDGALGEGSSDYFACTINGDPELAPGFYQGEGVLRVIEGDHRWPDDISWDPHETGLIYASAMWDLRKALIASLGATGGVALADRLNFMALGRATSIPTTYPEILAADDDDGDLANGTPHLCAIQEAFVPHGLTPYLTTSGTLVRHEPLDVVPPKLPVWFDVETETVYPQCEGETPDAFQIRWKYGNGAPSTLTLKPQGERFTASLPGQIAGTSIRYRVVATAPNASVSLPDNIADDEYSLFVGDTEVLYCNDFESQIDGFSFGDEKGGAGDVEWGAPQGLAGDPQVAFSGERVLGNLLGGTGKYRSSRVAFVETPAIDLQGHTNVRLQFRRWLTAEDGVFDKASVYVNGQRLWMNDATSEYDGQRHHVDKEWRFQDLDLRALATAGAETVKVRFELDTDAGGNLGGWNIDDLCVVAWSAPSQSPPPDAGDGEVAEALAAPLAASGGCGCRAAGLAARTTEQGSMFAAALFFLGLASRRRALRR